MDDKEIITLYLQRSQMAIIETKSKYGHYCRAIASNILSNYADIEECENDTYMAAWNIIPPNWPNKLSVFLGRVIRNIALDKYSYNKAKKRNNEFDVILSELEECLSSPDTVENQYEHGELAKSISKFLYTIDREARSVFIRRYWYSDSIKEISTNFNMSSSKVKSMLHRTRSKLKKHLEKEGFEI